MSDDEFASDPEGLAWLAVFELAERIGITPEETAEWFIGRHRLRMALQAAFARE